MSRIVPKKNVSKEMRDIKKPRHDSAPSRTFEEEIRVHAEEMQEKAESLFDHVPRGEREEDDISPSPSGTRRNLLIFFGVFLIVAVGIGSFFVWYRSALARLESLRSVAASAESNIGPVIGTGFDGDLLLARGIFGGVNPLTFFRELPMLYRVVGQLSSSLAVIGSHAETFRSEFPGILFGESDVPLTDRLKDVRREIGTIERVAADILSADSSLKTYIPQLQNYLSWSGHITRTEQFLDALIAWLESPRPHHVIVILQNSSEMRPTGGFWGSFVDVVVEAGHVASFTIYDVNELDRTDSRKIVPPKPLQVIASRFRAADANWFFEYPASAKKFAEFAESSSFYDDPAATVDAVIAVSPRAMRDILTLAGPLTLPSGVTITSENFITSIQEEVQEGQAKKATDPKRVLKELLPELLVRMRALGDEGDGFFESIPSWAREKDFMIWTSDPQMAKTFAHYRLDGGLYDVPRTFGGDYLAVVPANIGGAKTDLYLEQSVKLESAIDETGMLKNHLEISRAHHGDTVAQWWYREPNQAYVRIFTPRDARLTGALGGFSKKIVPKVSYASYLKDPDVVALEATREVIPEFPTVERLFEAQRNVFAFWMTVNRGKTAKASIDYSRRLPELPTPGRTYSFVLETQPGINSKYHISIEAPAGFIWQETDSPIYEYESADPSGSEVITLTFQKIQKEA